MRHERTILIVDDSATARHWERLLLEGDVHHRILTARDGVEGIRMAVETMPDLVLLDVVMPGMDGFEVCRALRAEPTTGHIPVLMITTRGDMASIVAGYESGCNEYLTKPVDAAVLLAKVRSYLDPLQEHVHGA